MRNRLIILILFLILLSQLNFRNYMNIYEIIYFNYLLFLNSQAGFSDLNKKGVYLLNSLTNDPLLIKNHKLLEKKYKKYIITYISTQKHIYILDINLAKQILLDSPELFSAGNLKEDFFKNFMPYNLGISKCPNKNKCPWKKRRIFNEKVLGTENINDFYKCINNIVKKNLIQKPKNVKEFRELALSIVSDTIYGNQESKNILKEFISINKTDIFKTDFYQKYIRDLNNSYSKAPKCSLLYYANKYKNDNLQIINDQIPHWFGPFYFIISYLIPNLLCIILNNNNIYNRINSEIKNKNFNLFSNNSYLHFVIIEHIRLFNTININIPRTVNKNMNYHELNLKKGDQIFMLFSSFLRDKKTFYKPNNFIPERWIDKSLEEQNIVFGLGKQICPSKKITPIYYKTIIYNLLLKYNYKTVYPEINLTEIYYINPFEIKFT